MDSSIVRLAFVLKRVFQDRSEPGVCVEKRSPVVAVAPFVPFRRVTLPPAISRKAQVEDTSPLLLPAVVPQGWLESSRRCGKFGR